MSRHKTRNSRRKRQKTQTRGTNPTTHGTIGITRGINQKLAINSDTTGTLCKTCGLHTTSYKQIWWTWVQKNELADERQMDMDMDGYDCVNGCIWMDGSTSWMSTLIYLYIYIYIYIFCDNTLCFLSFSLILQHNF